jgi:hypothetical protein
LTLARQHTAPAPCSSHERRCTRAPCADVFPSLRSPRRPKTGQLPDGSTPAWAAFSVLGVASSQASFAPTPVRSHDLAAFLVGHQLLGVVGVRRVPHRPTLSRPPSTSHWIPLPSVNRVPGFEACRPSRWRIPAFRFRLGSRGHNAGLGVEGHHTSALSSQTDSSDTPGPTIGAPRTRDDRASPPSVDQDRPAPKSRWPSGSARSTWLELSRTSSFARASHSLELLKLGLIWGWYRLGSGP